MKNTIVLFIFFISMFLYSSQLVEPINRVRLKGSPRGIITWGGDQHANQKGVMTNGDSVYIKVQNNILIVQHKKDGMTTTIFESMPDQMLASTWLGVYEYQFDDNPLSEDDGEQELVIINSPGPNVSCVKVFHMSQQPPMGIGTLWGSTEIEFQPNALLFNAAASGQKYTYSNMSFVAE